MIDFIMIKSGLLNYTEKSPSYSIFLLYLNTENGVENRVSYHHFPPGTIQPYLQEPELGF